MKSSIISRNQRYSETVRKFLQSMSKHTDEQLNRKPEDGGWSAIQTMHHLVLSEEFSMSYIRKKMGFTADFAPADWSARARSFLLWASLRSPVKFKAPPAIGQEHLPAYATLAETQERWEKARRTWEDFFEQMPEHLSDKLVYKHPRAGKISWMQTLAFFEVHLARHSKQAIRAVKRR